jgi:hypothetical protein
MEKNMTSARRGPPPWRRIGQLATVVAIATVVGVLAPMGAAFANTGVTGTGQAQLTGGSLAIGAITNNNNISVNLASFTGSGLLPTAVWSDATGSGYGWNGTVAVSDFTYTGVWTNTGSPLVDATSGAYTGTQDGVVFTVDATGISNGAGSFTWSSTASTNSTGSGTAVASIATVLDTQGVSINFGTATETPGTLFELQAGTQASSALSLLSSAVGAGATVEDGSLSAPPALVSAEATVSGPSTGPAEGYGAAIKFVAAAANTGMGSYTVNPGVSFTADQNSWANLYTANVEYSIVTGP